MPNTFTNEELSSIRDAVPALDLSSIRALRRAGFDIVRTDPAPMQTQNPWTLASGSVMTAR